MAQIHFVTGKGGTGKSTFAATLATQLSQAGEGPVLLLEIQGSGRSLEMLGATDKGFENRPLPRLANTWGARIFPRESFKQYFRILLALGDQESGFASATEGLRDKLTDLVFDNKVVSAFVDVCPGLEPAVLLGKVHWESKQGEAPESREPWRHVVVDSPATGHGLMLFRSTIALMEVFGVGAIFRQARDIVSDIRNPLHSKFYIVTTIEEMPLKESQDLVRESNGLGLPAARFVFNRYTPEETAPLENAASASDSGLSAEWQREVRFERESTQQQAEMLSGFLASANLQQKPFYLPEVFASDVRDLPLRLVPYIQAPT